jgi:hypothetical protein
MACCPYCSEAASTQPHIAPHYQYLLIPFTGTRSPNPQLKTFRSYLYLLLATIVLLRTPAVTHHGQQQARPKSRGGGSRFMKDHTVPTRGTIRAFGRETRHPPGAFTPSCDRDGTAHPLPEVTRQLLEGNQRAAYPRLSISGANSSRRSGILSCFNPRARVGANAHALINSDTNIASICAPAWARRHLPGTRRNDSKFQSTRPCGTRCPIS